MPLNRVILQGRVLTSPVDVPDRENRIRFALAVPRPGYLPRKRGGDNVDHLVVEVVEPSAKVRSLVEPARHVFLTGFLESRDSRQFGLVVRAQYITSVGPHGGANEVLVRGYLTQDPLLFFTRSRRPKIVFRLAVPRPRGVPDTPRLSYMSVEAYGDWVRDLDARLQEGVHVLVYGHIQSRDDAGDVTRGWPLSLVAREIVPRREEEEEEEIERELEHVALDTAVAALLERLKEETS